MELPSLRGNFSNPPHPSTLLRGLAFSVKANSLHSPSSKVKDTCRVVMSCVKAILQGTLSPYIRILRPILIAGPEQFYLYWESKLVCAETIRASDQVQMGYISNHAMTGARATMWLLLVGWEWHVTKSSIVSVLQIQFQAISNDNDISPSSWIPM